MFSLTLKRLQSNIKSLECIQNNLHDINDNINQKHTLSFNQYPIHQSMTNTYQRNYSTTNFQTDTSTSKVIPNSFINCNSNFSTPILIQQHPQLDMTLHRRQFNQQSQQNEQRVFEKNKIYGNLQQSYHQRAHQMREDPHQYLQQQKLQSTHELYSNQINFASFESQSYFLNNSQNSNMNRNNLLHSTKRHLDDLNSVSSKAKTFKPQTQRKSIQCGSSANEVNNALAIATLNETSLKSKNENLKLICTCRKKYDAEVFCIQCDCCNFWFHGR